MKKIILALLAITMIASANAQKNSVLLYGTLGLNLNTIDDENANTVQNNSMWNINPGVGYQFSHHFTVGIQGGFGSTRTETTSILTGKDSIYTMTSNNWSAGVFGRYTYYFNNMFSVWDQLDVSYVGGTVSKENDASIISTSEDTYMGFAAMLTPAIGIHIYDGFALNFSFGGIGFSTKTTELAGTTNEISETAFDLTLGQQVNFGITKNFNCGGKKRPRDPGMQMRKMKKHRADEEDDDE